MFNEKNIATSQRQKAKTWNGVYYPVENLCKKMSWKFKQKLPLLKILNLVHTSDG